MYTHSCLKAATAAAKARKGYTFTFPGCGAGWSGSVTFRTEIGRLIVRAKRPDGFEYIV